MSKRTRRNPYRTVFQVIILLLLAYMVVRPYVDKAYVANFEAYCPFGGLQAASSFMASNSLACSMTTTQIFMGLALVIGIIIASKIFCSHICPIGTVTEWLGRQGKRFKMNFVITGIADRLLRVVKYALLFVTVYFSVSNSELFCKTFDPYYAVFSGFGSDVMLSYAALALFLAIPGSFFVRQFWCKYTCPLGAASNIFSYSYVFGGLIGLYALLVMVFKLNISWVWLLAALSLAGMLLETTSLKVFGFSFFKIKRKEETCTSCKLCDKACPMAIKVSSIEKMQHVDCNLCGDCIASCPEKDTLKIYKKNQLWLPASIAVILILSGLAFASVTDIPTINIRWGNEIQMENAGVYNQSGLTSIKCFGSSMSFANQMKEVPGVLGVETFVSTNSVKVFYDKEVTNEENIRRSIFTPTRRIFAAPDKTAPTIGKLEVAIDKFFDVNDVNYLSTRFSQNKGIIGLQTTFGEPVHAIIYFNGKEIDPSKIISLIEERKLEWEVNGEVQAVKTNFKVAGTLSESKIDQGDYLKTMYEPVEMTFNSYEEYSLEQLETIEFNFMQAANPEMIDMPWYLLSHLSNDEGVVSFKTVPTNSGFMLAIQYAKGKTDYSKILKLLNSPVLQVHLSDGTEQTISNPFKFRSSIDRL